MAAPRTTRPFIGINADLVLPAKTTPVARLGIGYADAVTLAGGMPLILPPYAKDVELDALLDRLDGVVFTGGLDLDPRRAGQPTHPAVVPMPERREAADRRLLQAVIDRRMPLLSTYLGHTDPASTYWYLEAVPELLQLVGERMERLPGVLS